MVTLSDLQRRLINILTISGKSASGKNFAARKLEEYGYKTIVTYTTRPKRKGEKQDITYHFISDEEFKQKIDEEFFAEWKSYITNEGVWYYGSSLEDIENADDKSVIILTPQGYRDVKEKLPDKNIACIYLYGNNSTIKKRLEKRGDNPNEVIRRMESDNEDFKGFENEVDRIVYNNSGTDINEAVDKILKYLEEVKKQKIYQEKYLVDGLLQKILIHADVYVSVLVGKQNQYTKVL